MTLELLIRNAEMLESAMDRGIFLQVALADDREKIMDLQREQLLEGKDNDGNDLRPFYSEDLQPEGWFKSKDSALRYAMWKQTGISYPVQVQRNPDAPNLYITGKFHSEIGVKQTSTTIGVYPLTPYASNIVAKYGMDRFGLSALRWRSVLDGCKDRIIKMMKQELYE